MGKIREEVKIEFEMEDMGIPRGEWTMGIFWWKKTSRAKKGKSECIRCHPTQTETFKMIVQGDLATHLLGIPEVKVSSSARLPRYFSPLHRSDRGPGIEFANCSPSWARKLQV